MYRRMKSQTDIQTGRHHGVHISGRRMIGLSVHELKLELAAWLPHDCLLFPWMQLETHQTHRDAFFQPTHTHIHQFSHQLYTTVCLVKILEPHSKPLPPETTPTWDHSHLRPLPPQATPIGDHFHPVFVAVRKSNIFHLLPLFQTKVYAYIRHTTILSHAQTLFWTGSGHETS